MSRITTPSGATSTATELVAGVNLGGVRPVVTRASSGMGVETAQTADRLWEESVGLIG